MNIYGVPKLALIQHILNEKILHLQEFFYYVHHVFAQSGSRFGSGDVQTQYFVRR